MQVFEMQSSFPSLGRYYGDVLILLGHELHYAGIKVPYEKTTLSWQDEDVIIVFQEKGDNSTFL